MEGLKYMFPGASKLWVVIMLFVFGALSCQEGCRCRGCTGCGGCATSVVVDKETRRMKVDGVRIKLRANKNRVTNRKLRFNQEFYVDKNRWYSVDYHLRVKNRDALKNICEYEVSKKHNLKRSIAKFAIKFSPDKKHFAVGLDEDVYDFFHLLPDGVPFSSGCYYLNNPDFAYIEAAGIKFDDIAWSKFPDPGALFDKIIIPNEYATWSYEHNQRNVLKLLKEMKPGNNHEMVLINNWYCEIADLHFSKQRVERILKVSPQWKVAAEKILVSYIDEKTMLNDKELKASLDMVLWIDDKETMATIDNIIFNNYFAKGHAGNYFVERFKNRLKPLEKDIKTKLFEKAKQIGLNPPERMYDFNEKMSLDNAIDILLVEKEEKVLGQFIENSINLANIEDNFTNIPDVTIEKYNAYPEPLQKVMVEKYTEVLLLPDTDIFPLTLQKIAGFLRNHISCEDLKEIVRLHKEDLYNFRLPKGCK